MRSKLFAFTIITCLILFMYFLRNLYIWQQDSSGSPKTKSESEEMRIVTRMLQSVDFEVFGRVQGVFFRKYTREKGKQLGLNGWCMNTFQGTVVGTIQGSEEKIEEMKDWLKHTGSPQSKIEKAVFTNERHVPKEEFSDFFIKQ